MPNRTKPTALKVLQGTARKSRMNPAEPKPPAGAEPPAWLSDDARVHWAHYAPMLLALGVLTVADRDSLAVMCEALADYLAARDVVRAEGMTYTATSDRGGESLRARPEVQIASDAYRRYVNVARDFGLAPAPRAKVHAAEPDAVDPFAEFEAAR